MSDNQKNNKVDSNNINNYENSNLPNTNNYFVNYGAYAPNVPPFGPFGNRPYSNYNLNNPPNQNFKKQNQIILIPAQSPITQINQNNSTHPTLLGNALIPIINERPISASQKYMEIIKEVMSDFNSKKNDLENEIYKKLKKCDIHPKTLSEKCRKCKEIKKEIEKIREEIDLQNNYQHVSSNIVLMNSDRNENIDKIFGKVPKTNENVTNYDQPLIAPDTFLGKGYFTNQLDKTFKFIGDPITCNMNSLLLNNILSCQYFKEKVSVLDYYQLIDEIVKNVTYAEPWTVGTNGIPSTLFCVLYKFMLMKLTEGEVYYLVNFNENDYVRCCGFLYMRYMSDPKDLWNLFYPYLYDEKTFSPTIDSKYKITFGEYCENLLREYDYYGTRLSRIPIQIEREIKTNLYNLQQVKNRKLENEKNINLFVPNRSCRAVSFQDNSWHSGKIIQNLNNKKILVLFEEGNQELLNNLEITDNKWYNFDILKMRFNELKEIYLKEKREIPFFKTEEIVDLCNIILEEERVERKKDEKKEEKTKYKKKSRSNSRNSSISKSHGRHRRRNSSSSSRHQSKKKRNRSCSSESSDWRRNRKNKKRRKSKSKSRSRSRSNKRGAENENKKDKDKKLLERIIQEEKRSALAIGRDYASKPTSYKSSLSLRMPLGNSRKRSKSPSPIKQNIKYIDVKRESPPKEEKKMEYSEEFLQRSEMLKRQYGDSNLSTQNSKNDNFKNKTNDDGMGFDVIKLG